MKNKFIISTIVFIIILGFSFFALFQEKNKNQTPVSATTPPANQTAVPQGQSKKQIILFYGDGCPHCAKVEEYLSENNIKNKISFVEKEVYHNQKNADELVKKAKICGLATNSIGVPFLWDGGKCLIGDQDIINFFKKKINEK